MAGDREFEVDVRDVEVQRLEGKPPGWPASINPEVEGPFPRSSTSTAAMAEGSPQTAVDGKAEIELPSILLLLKNKDSNHPLEMQERFISSYRKRGGTIEVETFDGLSEHRMKPSPDQPETMRVIETIVAFIRRQTS